MKSNNKTVKGQPNSPETAADDLSVTKILDEDDPERDSSPGVKGECEISRKRRNPPTGQQIPEYQGEEYDSDCMIIVEQEQEDDEAEKDGQQQEDVTSTSQSPGVVNPNPNPSTFVNSKGRSQTHSPNPSLQMQAKGLEEEMSRDRNTFSQPVSPSPEDAYHDLSDPPSCKAHNLPIHELKKKLAYCSVCQTQYSNHKQANLCLSKHGKRQCWLCLDVMVNTKDSYFQHCVKNHTIGQSNDIVGCPYCQKFFDFRQGFNQHIVKVHFSEDTSYVSTTACLSPKSLVDIFTGKPRPREELEEERGLVPLEPVTTTMDISGPLEGSGSFTNLDFDIQQENVNLSCVKGNLSREFQQGGVIMEEKKGGMEVTRESVIREAPQSNFTRGMYHGYHHQVESDFQLNSYNMDYVNGKDGGGDARPRSRSWSTCSRQELPIMKMQKMVHSTTPVQLQYFDSVNTMLKTMAECIPSGDVGGGMQADSNNSINNAVGRRSSSVSSHSGEFKVPCSGGIKRRILTKWDEHQETKRTIQSSGKALVPTPTPAASSGLPVDFDQNQVEIRTDPNPFNRGNKRSNSLPMVGEGGQVFFEKVLKESTTTATGFKQVPGRMFDSYDAYSLMNLNLHLEAGHGDYVSYPRIMARVDSSGRPIGVFTADGQPCLLSPPSTESISASAASHSFRETTEGQLLTATEEFLAANHLQYQHKIIRQDIVEAREITSGRKRKSSTPLRFVASPGTSGGGESVVITNPFEEEEMASGALTDKHGSKHSQSTAALNYYSQLEEKVRLGYMQGNLVGRKVVDPGSLNQKFGYNGARLISYQSKLNSGGQITDFSKGLKGQVEAGPGNYFCSTPGTMGNGNGHLIPNVPVPMPPQVQAEYDLDPKGGFYGGLRSPTHSMGSWPPFSVCQRYYETTHNIMNKLKDLDKHRRAQQFH